jgi:4-diphosphocytidyl-2-C-methyl-D-erythritol kinase
MSLRALYEIPAPAKLNLFLHVIGRRADGYHLLQSVFVLIDWCDTLHFEHRDDARLLRHDIGTALPDDDLCLRAAHLLQRASGTTQGVDILIEKSIPWGAGLGGGSSDAASTLLALNQLWGLHWPRERLLELALPLGADVPFFVGGRNAFVEGIGERLTPLDMAPQRYAVVKPAESIATPMIFQAPQLRRDTEPAIVTSFLADTQLQLRLAHGWGRNDLQPIAEQLCPEVAQAARWLEARFGNSRMSGSGSAVYARVVSDVGNDTGKDGPPEATWCAEVFPPRWVGRLCRSLDRHPLIGWAG